MLHFYLQVEAFENFIIDNPGSSFRKQAFYGRLEAGYKRAITGVPNELQERLLTAQGYYNSYIKYFKNETSEIDEKVAEIKKEIDARLIIEEEPTS